MGFDSSQGDFRPSEVTEPSSGIAGLAADQETRRILEEILFEMRDLKELLMLYLPTITGYATDASPMSSQTR